MGQGVAQKAVVFAFSVYTSNHYDNLLSELCAFGNDVTYISRE